MGVAHKVAGRCAWCPALLVVLGLAGALLSWQLFRARDAALFASEVQALCSTAASSLRKQLVRGVVWVPCDYASIASSPGLADTEHWFCS
jgi:hypothetical protein